ncbi:2-dehydropantoate 2-reductase [Natronolimnobius sp. AArcel1]|uniref:ketopantoate reductase family protein n=1 Tax=Natronolimnobius sp. AArcel1 TaxID=1679093 RepID=UPI0013EA14E0|nr:2-dehydropantoate 2-reductase [Natronolimnobius sp. AArcel1]NGM68647.1 2-dehydropantoate 2-reductase [Natronolimnobius sp. AArcel1]
MDIVVFGAGSLGSLLGGLLAREHEVTLVARPAQARTLRDGGLWLTGEFDDHVTPAVTTDITGLSADLAIVAVKAFDTPSAAAELATGSFDAVLSVQNGMGNETLLADRLECPVLAGTVSYGALLEEPGVVACTGRGTVVLGARSGGRTPIVQRVGTAFKAAGLETTVATDMPRRLWEKLAVNAGINPITALTETTNATILEEPAADLARAAARETARVARENGVSLPDQTAVDALERVAGETAANTSSMAQDVRAGRRTEIDAINGYVVEQAPDSVAVPANWQLAALVRTWEAGAGIR